jgi:hypothetical protein
MSKTIDTVPRHTRKLIIEGLSRFGSKETAEFLKQAWISPKERNEPSQASRQAAHARFARALSMAHASCAALASEDKQFEDLMFDPNYCRLRPYRAETYTKAEFLTTKGIFCNTKGWNQLWHRASMYYIDVGKQIRDCSNTELLIANNSISLMAGAAVVLGETLTENWKEMWLKAESYGILKNPHFRLNLAMIGHYLSSSEAYTDCLLNEDTKICETVDLLTFVRNDHSEELNNLVVRIMRSDFPTPTECLFHSRPASTLNFTIDCIKRFTRINRHFSHPTMILMVLNWAEIASGLYAAWKSEGRFNARDCTSIEKRFKQLKTIQSMEKNRFLEATDALPPSKLRTRLFELWRRTYR